MTDYRWNIPGLPHSGWRWIAVTDGGDATHTCEMCGKERIRYVHHIDHPDVAGQLDVGCVCAAGLCDVDAKDHERRFKRAQRQRATILKGFRWEQNRLGDWWCRRWDWDFRVYPQLQITPFSSQVLYRARLDRREDRFWLDGTFQSHEDATAALYEKYLSLEASMKKAQDHVRPYY